MDYLMMKVCAMRLDRSVTSQEFVSAVQDIERDARHQLYMHLAQYAKKAGAEQLYKRVIDVTEGRGWVLEPESDAP